MEKNSQLLSNKEVTVGHSATVHGCYIEKGFNRVITVILDGANRQKSTLIAAGSLVTPNRLFPKGLLFWEAQPKSNVN